MSEGHIRSHSLQTENSVPPGTNDTLGYNKYNSVEKSSRFSARNSLKHSTRKSSKTLQGTHQEIPLEISLGVPSGILLRAHIGTFSESSNENYCSNSLGNSFRFSEVIRLAILVGILLKIPAKILPKAAFSMLSFKISKNSLEKFFQCFFFVGNLFKFAFTNFSSIQQHLQKFLQGFHLGILKRYTFSHFFKDSSRNSCRNYS